MRKKGDPNTSKSAPFVGLDGQTASANNNQTNVLSCQASMSLFFFHFYFRLVSSSKNGSSSRSSIVLTSKKKPGNSDSGGLLEFNKCV